MKKVITSIVFLFITTVIHAYIHFPTQNAAWVVRHGEGESSPSFYTLVLKNNDTVWGGNTYHKLYKSTDSIIAESELCGGLREDTVSERVYYYNLTTGQERLLYDFSLAVGDTVTDSIFSSSTIVVDSVDSINISGVFHKRIKFAMVTGGYYHINYCYWVEGIGNAKAGSLLNQGFVMPTCDCGDNTICQLVDGGWAYQNDVYASLGCKDALGISNFASEKLINVYPNPASGILNIQFGSNATSRLEIFDASGVLQYLRDISGEESISIDISSIPSSILFYRVISNAEVLTGSILLQH